MSQTLSISLFSSPVSTFEQARQAPVEGGIHQGRKVQQAGTATRSPSPAFRCVRSPSSVLKEAWTTAMPEFATRGAGASPLSSTQVKKAVNAGPKLTPFCRLGSRAVGGQSSLSVDKRHRRRGLDRSFRGRSRRADQHRDSSLLFASPWRPIHGRWSSECRLVRRSLVRRSVDL